MLRRSFIKLSLAGSSILAGCTQGNESDPNNENPCDDIDLGPDIFISNRTEKGITISIIINRGSRNDNTVVFKEDYDIGGQDTHEVYRIFKEFLEREEESADTYIATATWDDKEVSTEVAFENPALEDIAVIIENDDFSIRKGHNDPASSEARKQHEDCYWEHS
jgi:hypothetical protein